VPPHFPDTPHGIVPMRILLRLIALTAAAPVVLTVWFVIGFAGRGGLSALSATSVLGGPLGRG
jgi:hypothetical protein